VPEIIQYWDAGEPPGLMALRIGSWRAHNPDWGHRLCDRQGAAAFLAAVHGEEVAAAFLDIRLPAMQADVFRVAWVQHHGGLWVDAATHCLSPLRSWLDLSAPLVLLRKPRMTPQGAWNGFIWASAPQHPFLSSVWREIRAALLAREGTNTWHSFGPGLFKRVLAAGEFGAEVRVLPLAELGERLQPGSSSSTLPKSEHWSLRQQRESLYFSVPGSPGVAAEPGEGVAAPGLGDPRAAPNDRA
jgi:hypothetical protein